MIDLNSMLISRDFKLENGDFMFLKMANLISHHALSYFATKPVFLTKLNQYNDEKLFGGDVQRLFCILPLLTVYHINFCSSLK